MKDNVAHMIGTENMLRGVQPPPVEVGNAPHVHNDFGKFNEQWVLTYRNRPGADVLADFHEVTKSRLEALRALPPEEWEKEGFTPEGRAPYRRFMEIRVFDCWYHDQDIREALDRPGFLEGPAADLSLHKIVTKGLPYVVGKKAAVPPGSTVVLDIIGEPAIAGVPQAVFVDSDGVMGFNGSSRRYKHDIKPMDKASETLFALKPVTFKYNTDKKNTLCFGLIAEEVAEANPDLVLNDSSGRVSSVRYEQINVMLLNEFLKEHKRVEEQQASISQLKSEMQTMVAQLKEQAAQIQKVSAQLEVNKPAPQVVVNKP